MPIRSVAATRYVTPLREGGSVPAVVEADDRGTYVLKFRAAAQGKKALIAELIAGEIARALGLPMPELVLIELDPVLGRSEPDPELAGPLKQSGGTNLGMDFLPGAIAFDPATTKISTQLAARIVWFDAYVANVDRTARNPNLLLWGGKLQLIDHGAALYPQHDWGEFLTRARTRFPLIKQHVLLPFTDAAALIAADRELPPLLNEDALRAIVAEVPDAWLDTDPGVTATAARHDYVAFLTMRLAAPRDFAEEIALARAAHV